MTDSEKDDKRKRDVDRKEQKAARREAKRAKTEREKEGKEEAEPVQTVVEADDTRKTKKSKKDKKEKKDKKDKKDKKVKKSRKNKPIEEEVQQDVAVKEATTTLSTTTPTPKKRKADSSEKKQKQKKSKRARKDGASTTTPTPASTTTTPATPATLTPSTSKFMDNYTDEYLMELKKTNPTKLKEIRKARQKAKKRLHSSTTALENLAKHEEIQAAARAVKDQRKQKWEEDQTVKKEAEEKLWRDKPTKVFIGGLPFGVSERKLSVFFKQCGPFSHVDMPVFEDSGRSMGVAHIDFVSAKGAARCVEMNEITWCGRWLKIVFHDQMSREDGRYEQMRYGFGGNGEGGSGNSYERKEKVRPEQDTNPGPCPEGCTRVWIGGLPYDASKEEIIAAFAASGVVLSVNISTDKETNESKGFGHVVFATEKECEHAMETAATNKGVVVGTQTCRIDYATQRRWEKPRGGEGGESGNENSSAVGGSSGSSGSSVAAGDVHWKKAPTRSRNRGAVEDFKGAKVQFGSDNEEEEEVEEGTPSPSENKVKKKKKSEKKKKKKKKRDNSDSAE